MEQTALTCTSAYVRYASMESLGFATGKSLTPLTRVGRRGSKEEVQPMSVYKVSFISKNGTRVVRVLATSPGEAVTKAGSEKKGESVKVEEVRRL